MPIVIPYALKQWNHQAAHLITTISVICNNSIDALISPLFRNIAVILSLSSLGLSITKLSCNSHPEE
jgi:hypothetical protein